MIADRLKNVRPSPSMAAKNRVDALRAAGRTIVDFTIGEPDFPTPQHIVDAGLRALSSGQTRYTSPSGTPPLREAIAAKLKRENDLSYSSDEIVVGAGAKQIIFCAFTATLNEGDEVIIPAPYWVSYPDMVAINGGVPIIVASDESSGFKLTVAQLEKAITPRTRWLVLNTPNNPTGAVYTRNELSALCAVLERHPQVWLMTDEIYEHFVFGEATHVSPLNVAPELADRTLIINGVSKAYAMTGWRIGYGAGPNELVRAIVLLITQSTTCTTAMSQAAAIAALNGPQDCVVEAARLFAQRRDRMVELTRAIPGFSCTVPDGSFYLFPNVRGLVGKRTRQGLVLDSDVSIGLYLIEHANVATIDGLSYGLSPFLRMSFAMGLEQIEIGCAAMRAAVLELDGFIN